MTPIQKLVFRFFFKNFKLPPTPQDALWKLIDEENQKEEPRCDMIEAWEYAIEHIE